MRTPAFFVFFVFFGKTGLSVNPVGSTDGFILGGLASLRFSGPSPPTHPSGVPDISRG
jgi:hypothetical protein